MAKDTKFLTREQILAVDDLPHMDVDVPEWGGTVRVRTLRGTDRARLMEITADAKDDGAPDDWIERLVVACTCDEAGEPLFEVADTRELHKKNAKALQRIFQAADDLNMISDAAVDRLAGE